MYFVSTERVRVLTRELQNKEEVALPGMIRISALVVITALCASAAVAQAKIADLRAHFLREPNPVNKAKLMPQLGDAEFAEIDGGRHAGKVFGGARRSRTLSRRS